MNDDSPSPIRLLLVDDHFFVRMGLAASLGGEPDFVVVGEADGVASALSLYAETLPNVTLLDGHLSDGHGLDVLDGLRAEFPEARVLMLSVDESEESVFRAMEAGATGYLSKSTPRQQLLHAIREVAAGRSFVPSELEARLSSRRERTDLTQRELDVLRLVAKGESNKMIASTLSISEMTVKVHLSHIYGKMGVHDRTSATTTAVLRGLVTLE